MADEGGVVDGQFLGDVDFHVGAPCLDEGEAHFYLIGLACFCLDDGACRSGAPCVVLGLSLSVDVE